MTNYISITDFNCLNIDEKSWYLWHGATFLHVYENGPYRINLFFLNDYYIELWYDIGTNSIEEILAFTSTERLEPFLRNIDIDLVLN
jgi:hypothetical protein